jgi:acyl transferase domain-containing protein
MNDFYERISNLSQKRLILLAMDLQNRVAALEASSVKPASDHQAIAVIGMACRFPGDLNTPEAYWKFLQEGRDAVTEIPSDRWDINAYYDPDVEAPGKMSTRWGGFMSKVDQFDPALFGITPREATTMDPQQRIILEVCWEALERSGYAPDRLAGSSTGVFVGACNHDYLQMLMNADLPNVDMYMATGGAQSVISGRVSYVLGLQGPAITVDTACSSALVAIHYAIKSLRTNECRMALAGGVNAILAPDVTITLSKANMMATDGRCKAFAADADGFVRSDGCGMLVLKRLVDAEADGDPILAVIRGAAINQDGRSNGLTAPNGPSQVSVIRAALEDAGMTPADVSYVETHGTGTILGDPIEAQALGAAFGSGHTKQNPLMIGSAKTNLGHLESAAGVAGIMKLILSIQHGEIPPHLHLNELSPHIPWDELPITIPTTRTPWPGKRIGGISSFGFSGTNVHLLLDSYSPHLEPEPPAKGARPLQLFTLSAKTENSLVELAGRYEHFLENQPNDQLENISYSANTSRARLPYRLAVVAADLEQARNKLGAFHSDPTTDAVIHGTSPAVRSPDVTFLFTGHGAQYLRMGQGLYETEPIFRQVIDRCNELATAYLDQPLIEALYPTASSTLMDTMSYGQPAIFAVQAALTELWKSWGVQPSVVAGHSLGEYAAAVAAGIFNIEDGLKLVCARGRLMDNLPQKGSMAAIFAPEDQVAEMIQPFSRDVAIAVINHPTNIVISGTQCAVEAVLAAFDAKSIKNRRLTVAQAAHSPLLDPIREEFTSVVSSVHFTEPRIDLISSTTGQPITDSEISSPDYWWRHLRNPVQFVRLMETLQERGQTLFVEIGPHPVLLSNGQRLLPSGYGVWVPSLREKFNDSQQMLESLGKLFTVGVDVNWESYYGTDHPRRIVLPTYPFDHQRYWFVPGKASGGSGRAVPGTGISPLLEKRLNSPALDSAVFEGHISAAWPAYLDHHRIFGTSIAPSPAFIEMAVRAAEELFGNGPMRIGNLAIQEAMILPEEGLNTFQIILTQNGTDSAAFKIVSLDANDQWKTHTTGEVARQAASTENDSAGILDQITQIQARCTEQIDGVDYYAGVAAFGLEFGESFRGLQHVWRRDGEALGKVQIPEMLQDETSQYRFHPALLDACFHLLGAPLPDAKIETAYLLIGIDHFRLYQQPSGQLWNHTILVEQTGETFTGNIRLFDESGTLIAEAQGLQLKRANRELLLRAVRPRFDDWFYNIEWQPKSIPVSQVTNPHKSKWYILPDQKGFGKIVVERLTTESETCSLITPGEPVSAGSNVIFLAGLDATLGEGGVTLLENQVALCQDVIQAALTGVDTRLWIVTRGAQPANQSRLEPAQATLWGLGRVIALEHPEIWGGLIDLDPDQPLAEQTAALIAEIRAGDTEDQIAFRQNKRLVARLVRSTRPSTHVGSFSPTAAYLITGGLGGLGLVTARWMAEQGAGHILLTSRHGLPPRSIWDQLPTGSQAASQAAAIREIETMFGVNIEVAAVDVSDSDELQLLIQSFGSARPPLKGIIHAAAVLGGRPLADLTAGDLRAMFAPKILGAWNLCNLTQELDLDFLVFFSSTTALWGSNLLAHYAAANTFMDTFAHDCRSRGQPVLSVNWGTWEIMRVASQSEQQRTIQFGLEQMPVEAALAILGGLIHSDLVQITVASVEWTSLKAAYEARRVRPFLQLLESRKAQPKSAVQVKSVSLNDQMKALKPEERREFIVDHVRNQVARVISAPDPTRLNITQGLFEMGLDSLMSVELKGMLETSVGHPLPSTLTFNYPTISDLSRYLDETVLAEQPSPAPTVTPPPVEPAPVPEGNVNTMTEDELASLLASKLSGLK